MLRRIGSESACPHLKSPGQRDCQLEAAICAKIKSLPDFAERAEIIESVRGSPRRARQTSLQGSGARPGDDRDRCGLDRRRSYDDDSGKRRGERHIKGGRRWVRNAIYMACVGAATLNNPVLKPTISA